MKFKIRRRVPPLRRCVSPAARFDRDDPLPLASRSASLYFGLPPAETDPCSLLPDLTSDLSAADVGDLSYLFPDAAALAAIRSVKPDYQPPSREDRARSFLSDFLLCASLLEVSATADRISSLYPSLPSGAPDNSSFWRSRCRSVAAVISSLPPSREKLLLSLRYLHGIPVERAADQLSVSRRTAYRIHRRALSLVGRLLERFGRR